jgi:hypothetical protein
MQTRVKKFFEHSGISEGIRLTWRGERMHRPSVSARMESSGCSPPSRGGGGWSWTPWLALPRSSQWGMRRAEQVRHGAVGSLICGSGPARQW